MAVLAEDEDDLRRVLARDLALVDLRWLEVDRTTLLAGHAEAAELDEHQGENLRSLAVGRRTVWATIHCYKGEGEA